MHGLFGEPIRGVGVGTTLLTGGLDLRRKRAAWEKAQVVPSYDPRLYRKDAFGSWIAWDQYGNRQSDYGWEIDHKRPTVLGGSDELSNLRALHWRNNASLGGQLSNR